MTIEEADELQRTLDATDAKLDLLNRQMLADGKWDVDTYAAAQANLRRSYINVRKELDL